MSDRRVLLSPPDVGPIERQALLDAFDSGWIAPAGPSIGQFEAAMTTRTGWPGAVAVSSGTAALHLALLAVGVRPGDAVPVSSFTFAATANAVTYCGAEPVFVDSESASWNMCPGHLQEAIETLQRQGRRVGAVVAVDLYGQCADADAIREVCERSGVPVIEDAAEALGATYKGRPAGTLGDIGVFSFNGNKIITTSGGGMVITRTPEQADRIRYFATQARQPAVHYEHTDIGFNYRLSNLLAALGVAQLSRLDEMSARRLEVNQTYRRELADLDVEHMPIPEWSRWNGWLTCVLLPNTALRDRVIAALADDNIESRPLWKPMHLQPLFSSHLIQGGEVSADLFARGICLPSGSALSDVDIARVAGSVRRALSP